MIILFSAMSLGAAAGCSHSGDANSSAIGAEPLGLQMLRAEEQLQRYPFFTLLSFEREADAVFTQTDEPAVYLDSRAHTGSGSLRLPGGTRSLSVNLGSLHSGREWPGKWTLIGAYFYATQPQRLVASYELDQKVLARCTVRLPPGQWSPVLLDIAAALDGHGPAPVGVLRFTFPGALREPIWCDDVVEIDNTTVLVAAHANPGDGWTVVERGFRYILDRPGDFNVKLDTPEASEEGWVLREANDVRACFFCPARRCTRIIYAGNRQVIDGRCSAVHVPAGQVDSVAQEHASPAAISIPPEMGRVDRNGGGDANNDGYCEAVGTYQLIASGSRMEFTITPDRAAPRLHHPVLDIAGLPDGKVLATMEGRLVENIARLEDGRVLIELPGILDRATNLTLRVTTDAAGR